MRGRKNIFCPRAQDTLATPLCSAVKSPKKVEEKKKMEKLGQN